MGDEDVTTTRTSAGTTSGTAGQKDPAQPSPGGTSGVQAGDVIRAVTVGVIAPLIVAALVNRNDAVKVIDAV